jgi:hypothetical protein
MAANVAASEEKCRPRVQRNACPVDELDIARGGLNAAFERKRPLALPPSSTDRAPRFAGKFAGEVHS